MPIEITMPRLSDTMESGTVVKWNVKVGDTVASGDVLADIETDKATMELQAFDDGTVAKLAAEEGSEVTVGSVIAVLAESGESVDDAAAGAGASSAEPKPAAEVKQESAKQESGDSQAAPAASTAVAEPPAQSQSAPATSNGSHAPGRSTTGSGSRIFASPLARKIAAERGVDLAAIQGTGPSGRILKKDVEHAETAPAPSTTAASRPTAAPLPAAGAGLEAQTVPLTKMRSTIAKRLVESKQTIPHYQVTVEVDMDALLDLRKQLNEQLEPQGVKLSVNDFLVRACALAMHQHPFVNSSWGSDGKSVEINGHVNIGVAIALPIAEDLTGGGLVVATIRGADQVGLRQISSETKRLAKKARDKGLTIDEMSDASFTISNLGMFGVDHFTAIINPPNVCILAVGAAIQRPVVREGELTVGHVMSMTMSSDHRVVDGAMAAEYLATVRELLQKPATLLV